MTQSSAPESMWTDALDPAYVAVRAVAFIALLILIGVVVFRVAILGRLSHITGKARARMLRRASHLGGWAATLLLGTAVARLWLQSRMMNGVDALGVTELRTLIGQTEWGIAWLVQIVVTTIALIAFALSARGRPAAWAIAAVAAIVLAATPALGGHAASSAQFTAAAIGVDALHVFGAAGWLGALLCVLAIGVPDAVRSRDRRAWDDVTSLVAVFSPTALVLAGIVVLTGTTSAWLRLGGLAPLWTSAYGRVLLIKLGVFCGVVATGAYNWQRVRPALGTAAAARRLRSSGSVELAIGVVTLLVTAVLVAMPLPGD